MQPGAAPPVTFSLTGVVFGLAVFATATFVIMLAASLAVCAVLYTVRRGRFRVIRHRGDVYAFATDFGLFRPNPATGTLQVSGKGGQRLEFPFEELRGVRLAHEETSGLLAELALGFNLTDFFRRYRDTWEWWTVNLGLEGGTALPVFAIGQYRRREFLMDWFYALNQRILARLGLFHPAEPYARSVEAEIRAILRAAGAGV